MVELLPIFPFVQPNLIWFIFILIYFWLPCIGYFLGWSFGLGTGFGRLGRKVENVPSFLTYNTTRNQFRQTTFKVTQNSANTRTSNPEFSQNRINSLTIKSITKVPILRPMHFEALSYSGEPSTLDPLFPERYAYSKFSFEIARLLSGTNHFIMTSHYRWGFRYFWSTYGVNLILFIETPSPNST